MTEPPPRASDLEAGLAEIDRRLRQIQDELAGTEPPAPAVWSSARRGQGRAGPLSAVLQRASRVRGADASQAPPGAAPEPAREEYEHDQGEDLELRREDLELRREDVELQLEALIELRDGLLASIRELLEAYRAAARAQPGSSRRDGARRVQEHPLEPAPSRSTLKLTLSAGPFADLATVRAFELAVRRLPGVRGTSLRGYEGEDRAIVEVSLEGDEHADARRDPTS